MSVLRKGREAAASTPFYRAGLAVIVVVAGVMGGTKGTQDAVANGDTRSLTLYHNHTKETATITFRRNGQYDPRGLEQLNWMLRDWRRDEPTQMDPRLFDTLWEVYRQTGSSEPIHVNSAYRSPHTNAMLRRRSSAVAKSSQHMRGKAMDFYLPDVSIEKIRAIGMRLQNGGVGFYPNAYTPFVHLDVGSVRAWPRMTRDQLARLFPDGKTVHIPADGTPLEGYEAARAEVLARGFSVGGVTAVAEAGEGSAAPKRKSFWATLFGGSDEDEDAEEVRTSTARNTYVPRRAPPAHLYNDSNSSVYAALQPVASAPSRAAVRPTPAPPFEEPVATRIPVRQEPPPAPLPPPTRIAGLPTTVDTPTGPKLVWQQGATAQTAPVLPEGSNFDMLKQMALAPLPPRRPADVVVTGTLAFAPMPPARPGAIAAMNPLAGMGTPELRGPVAAVALATGERTDHPLPPPRPAARPIAVASLGAITMLPAAPSAADPGTAKAAQREPQKSDRTQIRSLFSDAGPSSMGAPASKGRPAAASGALSAPTATLASSFSSGPAGDLATHRFTGPAVKALAIR